MDNPEFDPSFRASWNAGELPYEPLKWEALAQRLDAHERRGSSSAPGAAGAAVSRTIPLYRLFATAAAACLIALLVWKGTVQDAETHAPAVAATFGTPVNYEEATPVKEAPAPVAEDIVAADHYVPAKMPPAFTTAHQAFTTVAQTPPILAAVIDTVPAAVVAQATARVVPPLVPKANPGISYDHTADTEPFEEKDKRAGKTAFGINGGYNVGKAKNNFTVGISVAKPLTDRLSLETGIAYVQGGYSAYRTSADPAMGATVNGSRSVQEVSGNLAYLQAAPTLNYRIYRGFSAGGGVDAQRLLSSGTQSNALFDAAGNRAVPQAAWDFGVMARADVTLAKKVRAGVVYRRSIKSTSLSGTDAEKRNYLLVQLSLTVF